MRKILLSTSAMIGLAFSITTTNQSVAKDQDPNLNIKGKTSIVSMYVHTNEDSKSLMKIDSAKINFDVKGSTDALGGIDYSLLIGLSGEKNTTKTAKETKIKIEKPLYGSLILGSTKGPDSFKKFGASKIIGATSSFGNYIKNMVNPDILWTTDLMGSPKGAVKLIYLSPMIQGFQLGVSYTPDTSQEGSEKIKSKSDETKNKKNHYKNNFVGQISYESSFENGASIGISATAIHASSNAAEAKNITSYAIGGILGYSGFEIGAEYIDNKQSGIKTLSNNKDAGRIINIGISYSFESHKIAAGFYNSKIELGSITKDGASLESQDVTGQDKGKNNLYAYSLTYDLKIANGIGIFAEANYFDYKSEKNNNKGSSILVGTKISF